MIEAARALFMMHGYDGVSVADLTDRVGGSKRDLYTWFGGKRELFEFVIKEECGNALSALRQLSLEGLPPEIALHRIGETFLGGILSAPALDLHRVVVGHSKTHPELLEEFMRRGPDSAAEMVAEMLLALSATGKIRVQQPLETASIFLDMLTAEFQLRSLTEGTRIRPERIHERVELAVGMLLDGLRPRDTIPDRNQKTGPGQ
jgi:TetR/AcrR family transcriptional repressor of mexJK operon